MLITFFGIKAKKDWEGESYTIRTAEYDKDNKQFFINAPFRKYNSWDESLLDHAKFFHTPDWRKENYKGVIGETDYKKSCRALQSSGYATSQDYANMLIELIEKYKLYEYDKDINKDSSTLPHSTEKENYDLVTYSNEIDEIPARMITKNLYIPSLNVDLYNTVKDRYHKVLHVGGSNASSGAVKVIAGKDRDETIDLVQQFIKENRSRIYMEEIKVNVFDKELYKKNLEENTFPSEGDFENLSKEDIQRLKEEGLI